MSDYPTAKTPTPSSPETPTTSSDAAVSDLARYRDALSREWWAFNQSQRVAEAMKRHPAGKALPPIDQFEETVHDLLFEVATKIVEARRG